MLKELSNKQKAWVDETLDGMTVKERLCHVLSPTVSLNRQSLDDVRRLLDDYPVGALFFFSAPADQIRSAVEMAQEHSRIPIIANMDILWGAGHVLLEKCTYFVTAMACGAADSPDLTYGMGKATASVPMRNDSVLLQADFLPALSAMRNRQYHVPSPNVFGGQWQL